MSPNKRIPNSIHTAVQRRKNAFKYSLCSSLFALSVNAIRIEMHRMYSFSLTTNDIYCIRVDTDCLSFMHRKDDDKILEFIKESLFNYKLENSKPIKLIQNFSRGSYRMIFDDASYILKIPGLFFFHKIKYVFSTTNIVFK